MILVDRRLEERAERGTPIRVAMVGAGFMGQGIANQILNSTPGMDLPVIVNRHPDRAVAAFAYAGADDVARVSSVAELDAAIARGVPAVTDDPDVVLGSEAIDAMVEVTGSVDYAADVIQRAINQGVHPILMNAEVDGTVGPYLRTLADAAGLVYTACDGDQPGVQGNLVRFVRGLGIEPLVVGNIKGLQDTSRNPTTQQGFADKWGQNVHMVTSFADGTKISFEQAIVANAFGLTVAERGMLGHEFAGHVDEAVSLFASDVDQLRELGGIVDYIVGFEITPGPGVFVFGTHDDPKQQHYLNLYKLGEGPLYSFYTPYHLCHFEVPFSVARAVEFGDAVLAPAGAPQVEVVATTKTDLSAGTVLDGMGGYHTYGEAETATNTRDERLLPMGVAQGCTLIRDVPQGTTLTYDDVTLPPGRLVDRLRDKQTAEFG